MMRKINMFLRIVVNGMILIYLGLMVTLGRALRGMGRIDFSRLRGSMIQKMGTLPIQTTMAADNPRMPLGTMTRHHFPSMNQLRIDLKTKQVYVRTFMNIGIGLARYVYESAATRHRSRAGITAWDTFKGIANFMSRYSFSQTSSGYERRSMERSRVDIPCDVKGMCHGKETTAQAHIADLSQGGMFLQDITPLDEGTSATITAIRFGETFWVMGKVLRSSEKGLAIGFTENIPSEIENILAAKKD